MKTFRMTKEAGFADTDAAGIVHFSRVFCFVEELEHRVLTEAGVPVLPLGSAPCLWPRVGCSAEFLQPVRAMVPLEVVLEVARVGTSSIEWSWRVEEEGACLARGSMKTVCCTLEGTGVRSCPLPRVLVERISGESDAG